MSVLGLGPILRKSDSFVNIDAILPGVSSSATGKIEAWVKPTSASPSANREIVTFGDTNGNEFLFIVLLTTGKINCHLRVSGVSKWAFQSNDILLTSGQWDKLTLLQDGIIPTLELNDVDVPITFGDTSVTSAWLSSLTSVDNARIGSLNYNNLGEFGYWKGGIDDVKIYDGVTLEGEYLFSDNVEDTSGNDYDGINNNVSFIDDRDSNPLSAGYFK